MLRLGACWFPNSDLEDSREEFVRSAASAADISSRVGAALLLLYLLVPGGRAVREP